MKTRWSSKRCVRSWKSESGRERQKRSLLHERGRDRAGEQRPNDAQQSPAMSSEQVPAQVDAQDISAEVHAAAAAAPQRLSEVAVGAAVTSLLTAGHAAAVTLEVLPEGDAGCKSSYAMPEVGAIAITPKLADSGDGAVAPEPLLAGNDAAVAPEALVEGGAEAVAPKSSAEGDAVAAAHKLLTEDDVEARASNLPDDEVAVAPQLSDDAGGTVAPKLTGDDNDEGVALESQNYGATIAPTADKAEVEDGSSKKEKGAGAELFESRNGTDAKPAVQQRQRRRRQQPQQHVEHSVCTLCSAPLPSSQEPPVYERGRDGFKAPPLPPGVGAQFTPAVEALFQRRASEQDMEMLLARVGDKILSAISPKSAKARKAQLRVYGSGAHGLSTLGESDLDLCLTGLTDTPCPYTREGRKQRLDTLVGLSYILKDVDFVDSGSVDVARFARVPILTFDFIDDAAADIVAQAPSVDGGQDAAEHDPASAERFTGARGTKIRCDLSIDGRLAMRNSALISNYLDIDSRVRPLVFALKAWARACGVKEASEGFLSSYSHILLAIYFLQKGVNPPVLPVLQRKGPEFTIGDFDCSFCDVATGKAMMAGSENTMSVGELLARFFYFYGYQFDYSHNRVNIAQPDEEPSGYHLRDVEIIDPFELRNVAKTLDTDDARRYLIREFRDAADMLCAAPGLTDEDVEMVAPSCGKESLSVLFSTPALPDPAEGTSPATATPAYDSAPSMGVSPVSESDRMEEVDREAQSSNENGDSSNERTSPTTIFSRLLRPHAPPATIQSDREWLAGAFGLKRCRAGFHCDKEWCSFAHPRVWFEKVRPTLQAKHSPRSRHNSPTRSNGNPSAEPE